MKPYLAAYGPGLNTNHLRGVWCAAVLCDFAGSAACNLACKFNTRQFNGLIDNKPGDRGYFRPLGCWRVYRTLVAVPESVGTASDCLQCWCGKRFRVRSP